MPTINVGVVIVLVRLSLTKRLLDKPTVTFTGKTPVAWPLALTHSVDGAVIVTTFPLVE